MAFRGLSSPQGSVNPAANGASLGAISFVTMPALTNAKLKALRAAFDAFNNIKKLLMPPAFLDEGLVEALDLLVQQTRKRAPGVLLPFNRGEYLRPSSIQPVQTEGVRAYVATAVSLLSVAIEDEGAIAVEHLLDFKYVADKAARCFAA